MMYLTLKKEATKPAAANTLQQQARLLCFRHRVSTPELIRAENGICHRGPGISQM
jgi:hypothetical protein